MRNKIVKKHLGEGRSVKKRNSAGLSAGGKFPPFAVDRTACESLTNQLTTGFRESIRIGYYRAGDVLPSVNQIALKLGVSEIVVRGAFRRLIDEGLLSSRRKIGHTVRTPEKPLWKGHVLCVMTDHDINPQLCVIVESLRRALSMKGYLFSQVTVLTDVKGPVDFSDLDVALTRPLDFAVTVFRNHNIEKHLSAAGVPFAVIGGKGPLEKGCVGSVVLSSVDAIRKMARQCVKRGISDVQVVSCPDGGRWYRRIADIFADYGIFPQNTVVPLPHVEGCRFDAVRAAGFDYISRRKSMLPQLYVVTDDFLAAGMLVGAIANGIDIPRDVRLIAYSNGGFGPFFCRPVAKIEQNADLNAEEARKRICDWLFLRKPFPNSYIQAKFIMGDTFQRD